MRCPPAGELSERCIFLRAYQCQITDKALWVEDYVIAVGMLT